MRKGRFTDEKKPDRNKEIKVFVEDDSGGMTIIRDDTQVIHVEGNTGPPTSDPGIDFNHPPPDTVIYTKTNPKCGWYYFNGKWYYR
jgi:hypothetical protein